MSSEPFALTGNTSRELTEVEGGFSKGAHEHHQSGTLPPDATASTVKQLDDEGKEVFGDEKIKHEILKKVRFDTLE